MALRKHDQKSGESAADKQILAMAGAIKMSQKAIWRRLAYLARRLARAPQVLRQILDALEGTGGAREGSARQTPTKVRNPGRGGVSPGYYFIH